MVAIIMPQRIVALGPLPARALLGAMPIRRRAVSVWQNATIPSIAAPIATLAMSSPAILLRVPSQRRQAWADLRLLHHSLNNSLTQK
jgi:DNA polymerase